MGEVTYGVSIENEEIQSEGGVLVTLKFGGREEEKIPAKGTK